MNLALANSEPFIRFHLFREELDRNMRVAYGGLQVLRSQVGDDPNETVTIPTGDEPWGDARTWRNVAPLVLQSSRFLSHMGMVRVMSAFEDFLINVKAEHDRYNELVKKMAAQGPVAKAEESDGENLVPLCRSLQWDTKPIAFMLPLYDYFTLARNCIVHRAGRASEALVKLASSEELQKCVAGWKCEDGKKLPALPKLDMNKDILFQPRHAVLASIVCYEAAKYLNAKLINLMGEHGVVYMGAYHTLFSDDPIPRRKEKAAVRLINYVLNARYRVTDFDHEDTTRLLIEVDKWKQCLRQYQKLYPD